MATWLTYVLDEAGLVICPPEHGLRCFRAGSDPFPETLIDLAMNRRPVPLCSDCQPTR